MQTDCYLNVMNRLTAKLEKAFREPVSGTVLASALASAIHAFLRMSRDSS